MNLIWICRMPNFASEILRMEPMLRTNDSENHWIAVVFQMLNWSLKKNSWKEGILHQKFVYLRMISPMQVFGLRQTEVWRIPGITPKAFCQSFCVLKSPKTIIQLNERWGMPSSGRMETGVQTHGVCGPSRISSDVGWSILQFRLEGVWRYLIHKDVKQPRLTSLAFLYPNPGVKWGPADKTSSNNVKSSVT